MADWFVRPDSSHGGTGDGKSYANALAGWSAIVWGGDGIAAGDTLYVCDAHTYSANIGVGGQVATPSSRITIRGDYAGHPGSITLTSGAFLDANRNYITITALTFTATSVTVGAAACISPGGAPSKELRITNNTFNCGPDAAIKFRAFSGWGYEDTIIDGNTFLNGSGATELGGCIMWYVTGAVSSTMKRLTITNNTFRGNSARATVMLKAKYGTALETCTIEDLIVHSNTYENCYGVALETECKKTVNSKAVGGCAGIKVYSNIIREQGLSDTIGGGFAISGFELSAAANFGTNDIYDNWCSGLHGLTGFCNPLYGTYRIFNNYAENITTISIDGCGVLPDHGCHDTVIFGNEFRDIHGDGSETYSATGFGILILDASNIVCYGNLIVNCLVGIGFGNKTDAASGLTQSADIYNNTFVNCAHHGVYLVGGANNTGNSVRNNIFTSRRSLAAVQVDSAAWTGESNNCFYGFGAPVAHTLAASTVTDDPQLDSKYRTQSSALKRKGVYLGGKDFYGKQFYNTPNIGAVEDVTNTPRYTLRYR
jgi:hypothetical protein